IRSGAVVLTADAVLVAGSAGALSGSGIAEIDLTGSTIDASGDVLLRTRSAVELAAAHRLGAISKAATRLFCSTVTTPGQLNVEAVNSASARVAGQQDGTVRVDLTRLTTVSLDSSHIQGASVGVLASADGQLNVVSDTASATVALGRATLATSA